ncbi:energy-coupling factor transporter ATP-binding protein EcfA2 [Striga asiatica]|uniref:Energy-coupling factor transporter ATP-binding protein EcfA2 n=1 Tax=Striga asiatica TaxID=4170 RepID=A0A5A7Q3I1_STRAF|nr:energy-coupling factor transporter ATP-binding protein EcfA2 [Striga asiatica]
MASSTVSLFGSKAPVKRSSATSNSLPGFSCSCPHFLSDSFSGLIFLSDFIDSSMISKTYRAGRITCDYSCFEIKGVSYRPPGTEIALLNGISLSLPEKSFGLIFGRSGSGKTTLLQLISGLSKPTSGSIHVQRYGADGQPKQSPEMLQPGRVGIVFQFPERFFVADNVLEELIFGWPRQKVGMQLRELLTSRLHKAMTSVGLTGISLDKDPQSLSGGYKRRLALAIQLVQTPDLLILDEPLAGLGMASLLCSLIFSSLYLECLGVIWQERKPCSLSFVNWKARADVVKLLKDLKKELTLLVVSHDIKELSSLVDQSWRMDMGGVLKRECLPF